MARRAEFSAQTLLVLAALCAEPREWRHGYGIARDTGLKSGSAVPDLDQAGRPWPGRGALGGGAAGRAAAPAPVPADPRGAGQRGGGAGGHACPGPGRDRRARLGAGLRCGGCGGRTDTRAGGAAEAHAARLLPPGRRQWAEAVGAEAGEVAAGWPRLCWLAGGLWLAVREAAMARKVVYWLGPGRWRLLGLGGVAELADLCGRRSSGRD